MKELCKISSDLLQIIRIKNSSNYIKLDSNKVLISNTEEGRSVLRSRILARYDTNKYENPITDKNGLKWAVLRITKPFKANFEGNDFVLNIEKDAIHELIEE